MEKQLCIGFSGPSGSGKTTLAKWLSQESGIQFVENSAGFILSEELKDQLRSKYGWRGNGHAEVIRLSNENPKFGIDFQVGLLKSRIELLTKLKDSGNSFIVDRTMLDNIAYFLIQCGPHAGQEGTQVFINEAEKALSHLFTHLFLVKPNESWTEDNGSRVSNNQWQNLVVYPTFESVFQKVPKPFRHREINFWDLQARKQLVRDYILNDNLAI